MCLIVRVIVHAKDEEEALKKGKEALNEIAEETVTGAYITYDSKELLDRGVWPPPLFILKRKEVRRWTKK